MQVLSPLPSNINQEVRVFSYPQANPDIRNQPTPQIPRGQNFVVQPLKYLQHFPELKKRRYKTLQYLDLKASPSVKFQKVKRVLENVKYIAKAKIEFDSEKNFEHLYTILCNKVLSLDVDKISYLPAAQKKVVVRRLREFRYLTSLNVGEIKGEHEKYTKKELNNFQYSIQSLRNLESVSFLGNKNLQFLKEGIANIFPFLNKIKKIEAPIDELVAKDLARHRNTLARLTNVQEFKLEIAESGLRPRVLENLKRWMSNLPLARKLVLVVTNAEFRVDLSTLNEIEVLEIVYELSSSLSTLANNVFKLQNLSLPVSFDWKVNPSDAHNYAVTETLMQNLFKLRNVKKVSQLYSFQDELSVLKGCYPIWRDIIMDYNFRMIESLNLGIFLNESIVDKFQTLLVESLRSMHRLRTFGLTLHNDGSSAKRFHLTGTILELPRVIGELPCLTEFEFNTEIEIMLNILTEFFRGLTQLKNLRKFRSEWLQTSQNSFKAFAKRLHQMRNLELLDIHLYTLYDIPKKELDAIFFSLGESLEKMPNLKAIQITADNECFAQENVWQQWQDILRTRCDKKFIELTLAETE